MPNADLDDTSGIPTDQVLHTLMTSMHRRKNVYGYVVSGYPRHLRDVAVYSERASTLGKKNQTNPLKPNPTDTPVVIKKKSRFCCTLSAS